MKTLIITYYWPPAGGSGVQRWLKFVKYLRDFGVEPIVYTVKNASYSVFDESLKREILDDTVVIKQGIFEPNALFGKASKKVSSGFLESNPSFFGKIMRYVRANYFIPDARKFWIKPSVKFLSNYLKEHAIDAIITTGPPHSLHLIGLALKKQTGIKWLADFRDPWTEIDYFHQLPLTKRSIKKHQHLEEQVLKNADTVVVVSKTMAQQYKKHSNDVHVITNGFDRPTEHLEVQLDPKFSIVHIGMMNSDRNHEILWKVLSELVVEHEGFDSDLELKFVGKVAHAVTASVEKYNLQAYSNFIGYVEHHSVLEHQRAAQVLLLSANNVPSAKGITTGKVFEYLQSRRPILAIAPTDGDLAEILRTTNSGVTVDFDDKKRLKAAILDFYASFKSGSLQIESSNIEQYHRKNLTQELVRILRK